MVWVVTRRPLQSGDVSRSASLSARAVAFHLLYVEQNDTAGAFHIGKIYCD
jgi:hypothetical protein